MKLFYPGTFDPITRGHLNIIRRASAFASELVIGVAASPSRKDPLLSAQERKRLIEIATANLPNIQILIYQGAGLDTALAIGCEGTVRGIRNGEDFDYEQTYAQKNCEAQEIAHRTETIFLATCDKHGKVSSSSVREKMLAGEPWQRLVPILCAAELERILAKDLAAQARVQQTI